MRYKGHTINKTYIPNKPYKWGLLLRAACTAKTGFCVNMFLHSPLDKTGNLNTFQKLLDFIDQEKLCVIADNFYTCTDVVNYCKGRGWDYIGTIKKNYIRSIEFSHVEIE